MTTYKKRGRPRAIAAATAVLTATAGLVAVTTVTQRPAMAEMLMEESFTSDSTAPGDWIAPSPKGDHQPCLTAAAKKPPSGSLPWCKSVELKRTKAETDGKGAFQITDNSTWQAGGLILNRSLSARGGLHITFDQFQYNTTSTKGGGADGISFFLIDGQSRTDTVGKAGYSLGYQELPGAVVGVAFDQFGNFSTPKLWTTDAHKDRAPGQSPNSVVVRGAQSTGYQYLKGVDAPKPLGVDGARTREKARISTTVDISTANVLSVFLDYHDGKGNRKVLDKVALNDIPGQPPLPESIKLGFAASTGSNTNIHEIQNFAVRSLDPDLTTKVTPTGTFRAGGTGIFRIETTDKPSAGPAKGPNSVTFDVPKGLTPRSADGDGWDCSISGQRVECVTDRPLKPGETLPPVDVIVKIPKDAPPEVVAQASSETPDEHKPEDNVSPPVTVRIEPLPPDVSTELRTDGPFQAGGTGKATVTVSNAADAGPTTGPVSVEVPAPPGTTITDAVGGGWSCTAQPAKVRCVRADALPPGETYPPVRVTYDVPASLEDDLDLSAKAGTPGDSDPSNDASATVAQVLPAPPDLRMELEQTTPFGPGGAGKVTATVGNSDKAGPTASEVRVTVPAPTGATITAAVGAGWTCGVEAGAATCTRPGKGRDALRAGESYPGITVALVANPIPLTAKVSVDNEAHSRDNTVQTLLESGR